MRLEYPINYNDSINYWLITDLYKTKFESLCESFEAEVNSGEDYVQIIYPIRKEFLKKNRIDAVKYYEGRYKHLYFPFESNKVDFTSFSHIPYHFWVYAKTYVNVEKSAVYNFELYTCGGIKIWINNKEILCFTPYTRNIASKTNISLELNSGINEIVVYSDELAERDVFFYYELRYKGVDKISNVVFVEYDPHEILSTESFLKSCYFEKDCFEEGELILKYDNFFLDSDKELIISEDEQNFKINNISIGKNKKFVACKDKNEVSLGNIKEYNIGVFKIYITVKIGEYSISRDLVIGINPKNIVQIKSMDTIKGRKMQILEFISNYGENVVNRTMAILEIHKKLTDVAYNCLLISLKKIEKKEDCADFYLVPMILLIKRYRKYLSDELYIEIKRSIIDFRYWIDEPGNDVMWYFSENHSLLFHISQYLSGDIYKDEIFTVSKRKGKEQCIIGKKRLSEWFNNFFKYGYSEWNSATYIPINLIGFFVLYELAPDAIIRDMTKKALDFTFKIISYNTFNGIMSSSFGRAYEDTLKVRELTETSFIEWISYNKGYVNFRTRAVSLYCLSDYIPPDYTKELKLNEGEGMSVEFDQGLNKVKTYLFKTRDYFISSVRRFKPFKHGHQQHLMNVALGGSSVQFYINHPGERAYSGGNRPSYWAGNGTMPFVEQYRNLIVMLYKINPDEIVHYIHAYCTFYSYDETEITDNWTFLKIDNSYLGIYFSNGVSCTDRGANTGKEIISYGLNHFVMVKCGSKTEFNDFKTFKVKLKNIKVRYDEKEYVSFTDPQYGEFVVNGINNVTLSGKELEYKPKPQMEVIKETI
ncbi:MAG: hypothetical protein ABF289_11135 [Clostridiales bacterium]